MKLIFLIAIEMIAFTVGDVSHLYLPPENVGASTASLANVYLPPENIFEASQPIKKIANAYLPPDSANVIESSASVVSPTIEPAHVLAEDGYHYKTPTYRHRRDAKDVFTSLPSDDIIPRESDTVAEASDPAHVLMDDGYRYKSIRRLKYRHRRDVSELQSKQSKNFFTPANDYLPPQSQQGLNLASASVPQNVVLSFPASNNQNQAVVNEYLPPISGDVTAASSTSLLSLNTAQNDDPAHVLTNDGYQYKTVRRIRYRQRRDVNQLKPKVDYLPPNFQAFQLASASIPKNVAVNFQVPFQDKSRTTSQSSKTEAAASEIVQQNVTANKLILKEQDSIESPEPAHVLAEDGYHYKTA